MTRSLCRFCCDSQKVGQKKQTTTYFPLLPLPYYLSFCIRPNLLIDYTFYSTQSSSPFNVKDGKCDCCWPRNTLGTRGFSRARREFSVLAEGRHIFDLRVTIMT